MYVTIQELKVRILRIEQELGEMRRVLERLSSPPEEQIRESESVLIQWVDQAGWDQWFDQWFEQLGITVQPLGAERLQALMLREGVRPEENLLSRGIIEMRDE